MHDYTQVQAGFEEHNIRQNRYQLHEGKNKRYSFDGREDVHQNYSNSNITLVHLYRFKFKSFDYVKSKCEVINSSNQVLRFEFISKVRLEPQ